MCAPPHHRLRADEDNVVCFSGGVCGYAAHRACGQKVATQAHVRCAEWGGSESAVEWGGARVEEGGVCGLDRGTREARDAGHGDGQRAEKGK
eukprot:995596-Prymnesium_polylepis.1